MTVTEGLVQRFTIAPASARAFTVKAGQRVRVLQVEGQQVGDLVCFNLTNLRERFSSSRTLIENGQTVTVGQGSTLYSNAWNPMFVITDDELSSNDVVYPPCSRWVYEHRKKVVPHTGCYEHLAAALTPYGLDTLDVPDPLNLFMVTEVEDGRVVIKEPKAQAGAYIDLVAQMDCLVALSACAVETGATNAGRCKPLEVEIWSK